MNTLRQTTNPETKENKNALEFLEIFIQELEKTGIIVNQPFQDGITEVTVGIFSRKPAVKGSNTLGESFKHRKVYERSSEENIESGMADIVSYHLWDNQFDLTINATTVMQAETIAFNIEQRILASILYFKKYVDNPALLGRMNSGFYTSSYGEKRSYMIQMSFSFSTAEKVVMKSPILRGIEINADLVIG